MTTATTPRQRLQRLVEKHHGNLTAIAREFSRRKDPITRQGVAQRLAQHGLQSYALDERRAARVTGPRLADDEALAAERAQLLQALGSTASYSGAQRALGLSRRTFYRKLAAHGITVAIVAKARRKK